MILGLALRSIPRTSPPWNTMGLRHLSHTSFCQCWATLQTQQQQQAHFLKHLGLKVFSLIAVYTVWHTILIGTPSFSPTPLCTLGHVDWGFHLIQPTLLSYIALSGCTFLLFGMLLGFQTGLDVAVPSVLAPTNTWHISDNCFSTYTRLLPNQKGLQNLAFTFLEDFIILKWPPAGPS